MKQNVLTESQLHEDVEGELEQAAETAVLREVMDSGALPTAPVPATVIRMDVSEDGAKRTLEYAFNVRVCLSAEAEKRIDGS